MFYGIYAPYWYSFERQRIAPALMEFVRAKNYQLALHTSQSFDYPELRHTLFTGIPEQNLQELKSGVPWKRDSQNITDIIGKLEQRDRQRPFFGFMFFESTHAPYTFPEETALLGDYQKDLNYINMNLQENVKQIHARYVNAAHHIDREVGRLIDYLERSGMLGNTIVLFTGDHGEEFMEKGSLGTRPWPHLPRGTDSRSPGPAYSRPCARSGQAPHHAPPDLAFPAGGTRRAAGSPQLQFGRYPVRAGFRLFRGG